MLCGTVEELGRTGFSVVATVSVASRFAGDTPAATERTQRFSTELCYVLKIRYQIEKRRRSIAALDSAGRSEKPSTFCSSFGPYKTVSAESALSSKPGASPQEFD
jgi:hypothetical protein